ncbi:tRNA-guanine transglycosylase DpdA [Orlajensenia leifsoniae]|uniref:Queuine/other tRNA-ribosyltransferase n=1 Tax=Orlajensenia leifsoniae TaxID=2561933 RepID=A0A4Y9QSG7_9MICO|nr:tRNA-guanine transglycosylase DpdA [Leifsonia flava]TFV95404.1 queuine/other tRNA-ribosyltransferase [Leifsonia flava]
MRFYFPDSQDLISPTYDFEHDEYMPTRVRQRDDRYAHEVLDTSPYHGMLVSKAIVDGSVSGSGKYTSSQRARLYRMGVRRFFRLPDGITTLGDNGAFNYVTEEVPPVTVDETLDFYDECGFDAGVSVDHIIFGYEATAGLDNVDPAWSRRRELTLELAADFRRRIEERGSRVQPVGAAQGWSPASYADSVARLQEMGYRRIALGGMVPLKTKDVLDCLRTIGNIRLPSTELHLLGLTRVDAMEEFAQLGVTSFDSTSPFRQAFMDDRNNFHTPNGAHVAIRVPQVDGNPTLRRAILAGAVSQQDAIAAERDTLRVLRLLDGSRAGIDRALAALGHYEIVVGAKKSYLQAYEQTLVAAPWADCKCRLCRMHGIEIAIFRGTERNKRRGFHNLTVLANKVSALTNRSFSPNYA